MFHAKLTDSTYIILIIIVVEVESVSMFYGVTRSYQGGLQISNIKMLTEILVNITYVTLLL